MTERRWLTRKEIDEVIEAALEVRMAAWEARMSPTLDALRDGAQSALMTNMLLVGDGRFVEKGFIQETRDRFTHIEEKQAEMHTENTKLSNVLIERQGLMMRCIEWLTHKDEDGERRWHRLVLAGGAAGSGVTWMATHVPTWLKMLHHVLGR